MMYKVSFQYSENVYCTNIVIAENREAVNRHYNKYPWVNIRDASVYDIQEATAKGMPIITL